MATRPPPRFVVRPHSDIGQPRHWLWLGLAWAGTLVLAGLIGFATSGRQGPAHSEQDRLRALQTQNDDLQQQVANLQRSQQVNDIATRSLRESLAEREEEISGLRTDLGFYSRLIGGDAQREGLKVQELRVQAVAADPHAWNFAISLTQNVKRGEDVSGLATLSVDGLRAGKVVQLDWPALGETAQKDGIPFRLKYFQQLHGSLVLPADFRPTRLHVRVQPEGDQPVARDVAWNDALAGKLTTIQGDHDAQP